MCYCHDLCLDRGHLTLSHHTAKVGHRCVAKMHLAKLIVSCAAAKRSNSTQMEVAVRVIKIDRATFQTRHNAVHQVLKSRVGIL